MFSFLNNRFAADPSLSPRPDHSAVSATTPSIGSPSVQWGRGRQAFSSGAVPGLPGRMEAMSMADSIDMTTVRRTMFAGSVKFLGTLGERQIRVVASDDSTDRVGDVLVPEGCSLAAYRRNPVV